MKNWRVYVHLDGRPTKFDVRADTKKDARQQVQDRLGPRDLWFYRTVERRGA